MKIKTEVNLFLTADQISWLRTNFSNGKPVSEFICNDDMAYSIYRMGLLFPFNQQNDMTMFELTPLGKLVVYNNLSA